MSNYRNLDITFRGVARTISFPFRVSGTYQALEELHNLLTQQLELAVLRHGKLPDGYHLELDIADVAQYARHEPIQWETASTVLPKETRHAD